ncbi:hypothetical protein [Pseudomonas fragi]|uniref:hypothetical protein n=1 Tax=Pseudomonas fragi TaxID=296 RepID=UPI001F341706|nr:hypothetical protein [Pseudomonas fragi]MCF6761740.1 hypothetical protein [Pseudomonas fragi]
MNKVALACLLATLGALPAGAVATDIDLKGKTTSNITATVSAKNNLLVTSDTGGWFDQGLEMLQTGEPGSPFAVQARLKVVSTERNFQVRLEEPLAIRNASNAAKIFQQPKVELSQEFQAPKTLSVTTVSIFQNPVQNMEGEDSIGYYGLSISAYPPAGTLKETTGTYTGVLSLTFEPVISNL